MENLPYVLGSATSEAAAKSMARGEAKIIRTQIAGLIKSAGSRGLTCDEVEVITGHKHQTASARIKELVDDGVVKVASEKRATRSGRAARVLVHGTPTAGFQGTFFGIDLHGNPLLPAGTAFLESRDGKPLVKITNFT